MNFRPMKLLPLAMALAVVPMFAHGEDLLDAYHQAVANDPVLAQQLAQRNITGEGVPLAWAPLLPHLSAGLSLTQYNGGATTMGTGGTAAGNTGSVAPVANVGHTRQRQESITLTQTILDSIQRTLQYNFIDPELGDPSNLDVYFCLEGGDISLEGGAFVPHTQPYQGLMAE